MPPDLHAEAAYQAILEVVKHLATSFTRWELLILRADNSRIAWGRSSDRPFAVS